MPSASLAYAAASAAAAVAVYHFCIARPRSKRAAANKRVQSMKSRTPDAQLKAMNAEHSDTNSDASSDVSADVGPGKPAEGGPDKLAEAFKSQGLVPEAGGGG